MQNIFFSQIPFYFQLIKFRIGFFCILMTYGGFVLASSSGAWNLLLCATLVGTFLTVSCANVLNMILERQSDSFMKRTQNRPLVLGLLSPVYALLFALFLGVIGTTILFYFVNFLTALLALLAILLYGFVYTPLKKKTPLALVIGAIPGAAPPLLGWTAVTQQIQWGGVLLFGILFAWQMPHFIAIAIRHQQDYERAGIQVVPVVRGERIAVYQSIAWSAILWGVSLLLYPFHLGGLFYLCFAFLFGFGMFFLSLRGLFEKNKMLWAKKLFFASLFYLPLLVLILFVDRFFKISGGTLV